MKYFKIIVKFQEDTMISMWQMGRGSKEFRFQTNEPEIKNRMSRRKNFLLVGSGVNCSLWLFQAKISRTDTAKNILKTLSGENVELIPEEDVFVPESFLSKAVNKAS